MLSAPDNAPGARVERHLVVFVSRCRKHDRVASGDLKDKKTVEALARGGKVTVQWSQPVVLLFPFSDGLMDRTFLNFFFFHQNRN